MKVETFSLKNIKHFEDTEIDFRQDGNIPRWINLLGDNGSGKTTILKAISLMLIGPESAIKKTSVISSWVNDDEKLGEIHIRIMQEDADPGEYKKKVIVKRIPYRYYLTGKKVHTINNEEYYPNSIVPDRARTGLGKELGWLRTNAFKPGISGWFACSYGAFRAPNSLSQPQSILIETEDDWRERRFASQFSENSSLSKIQDYLAKLEYTVLKNRDDTKSQRLLETTLSTINHILPPGVKCSGLSKTGELVFLEGQKEFDFEQLSDGQKIATSLAGDLCFHLIQAFPESENPFEEPGVALIDEIDAHIHPSWQRMLPQWLQERFPRIQFIVATHSPIIAYSSGVHSLTLTINKKNGKASIIRSNPMEKPSINHLLLSQAFGLTSTEPPDLERSRQIIRNHKDEPNLWNFTEDVISEAKLIMDIYSRNSYSDNSLDSKIKKFLSENL